MRDVNNLSLHQKGSVVVLKETVPDVEFNSKDILDNIGVVVGEQAKLEQALKQAKESIPKNEKNLESNAEMLKKLKKFEEWAVKIQESKIRAIIEEIKDSVYARVVSEYTYDKTLTDEQNDLQKFMFYQKYLSTHERVAKEINNGMMKEHFYEHPVFENPWKK